MGVKKGPFFSSLGDLFVLEMEVKRSKCSPCSPLIIRMDQIDPEITRRLKKTA